MDAVCYAHIELNADGEAIIAGTRIKVRMIAIDRITHNWDAEEIQRHHPDLSLGQVHSALAYYYDHKEAMDGEIETRHERVAILRAGAAESPGRQNCGSEACSRECRALHGSSCGCRCHRRAPPRRVGHTDLSG